MRHRFPFGQAVFLDIIFPVKSFKSERKRFQVIRKDQASELQVIGLYGPPDNLTELLGQPGCIKSLRLAHFVTVDQEIFHSFAGPRLVPEMMGIADPFRSDVAVQHFITEFLVDLPGFLIVIRRQLCSQADGEK